MSENIGINTDTSIHYRYPEFVFNARILEERHVPYMMQQDVHISLDGSCNGYMLRDVSGH